MPSPVGLVKENVQRPTLNAQPPTAGAALLMFPAFLPS
jgi:hypothetical protein